MGKVMILIALAIFFVVALKVNQGFDHDKDDIGATQSLQQKINLQLKAHNQLRAKHGAPPLKLSSDLNKIAQAYAQKLKASKKFEHSGNKYKSQRLGENLYWLSNSPAGGYATAQWYKEIDKYKWDGKFSPKTAHFTQLVWKSSKEVGFGFAGGIVVANYLPAGNVYGKFKENVLRKK